MISVALQTGIGEAAPQFTLPSVQGGTVDLAAYRGRRNVIIWFSRGFTCPFCRSYMEGIIEGYESLRGTETEVIQVAPNLLESARRFFGLAGVPYPFVCDPDKRLYAVYGLGDRGTPGQPNNGGPAAEVTVRNSWVNPGTTFRVTATAVDADGKPSSTNFTWASQNPGTAKAVRVTPLMA